MTIIEAKLVVPDVPHDFVSRPRLLDLLERSIEQYGATLISGRAGTGKTALAADFVDDKANVSWCSIEPSDSDWREFSALFRAGSGARGGKALTLVDEPTQADIAEFLNRSFPRTKRVQNHTPRLIVLDNVHHLFDTAWFPNFFQQLVTSLDATARLLMLCRSKPSTPLWRMRSKQMLNVVDEALIDLTESEAREIAHLRGLPPTAATEAFRCSFGRISNFLRALDKLCVDSADP